MTETETRCSSRANCISCDCGAPFLNGEALAFQKGHTELNGRFLFLPHKKGLWEITVKDGMGHQLNLKTVVGSDFTLVPSGQESGTPGGASPEQFHKAVLGLCLIGCLFGLMFLFKRQRRPPDEGRGLSGDEPLKKKEGSTGRFSF